MRSRGMPDSRPIEKDEAPAKVSNNTSIMSEVERKQLKQQLQKQADETFKELGARTCIAMALKDIYMHKESDKNYKYVEPTSVNEIRSKAAKLTDEDYKRADWFIANLSGNGVEGALGDTIYEEAEKGHQAGVYEVCCIARNSGYAR